MKRVTMQEGEGKNGGEREKKSFPGRRKKNSNRRRKRKRTCFQRWNRKEKPRRKTGVSGESLTLKNKDNRGRRTHGKKR